MHASVANVLQGANPLFHDIAVRSSEGIVLLDRRGRIAWANDAALHMHGVDKLPDLGGTAAGYRRRHTLHYRNHRQLNAGQYPLDRLLSAGGFSQICVDVRRKGDTQFHRVLEIRGLALKRSDETLSGALVILDATDKFEAQERFERTFDVNPAPAIICQLSSLRYIKVNNGFLQMTGYRRQDLIGKSTYEIDMLRQADQRDEAIENLKHGATIAQMEAVLRQADGRDKHVIVAGQPIEVDHEPCMLFTFIDLTARRQAQEHLRQSEEKFSKTFRLAPVPMMLNSLEDGRLMEVNAAFLQTTGHAGHAEAEQALDEQELWADPGAQKKITRQIGHDGSVRNAELSLRLRSGHALDCLVSAEIVTLDNERCALWVIQDITQRKRSEAELIQAIETVMQDASWFSRSVVEKLAQLRPGQGKTGKQAEIADLTAREQEILSLMCQGKDDREIGETLGISRHTVRNHVAAVYSKVGVHRRGAAIVWALERGIGG